MDDLIERADQILKISEQEEEKGSSYQRRTGVRRTNEAKLSATTFDGECDSKYMNDLIRFLLPPEQFRTSHDTVKKKDSSLPQSLPKDSSVPKQVSEVDIDKLADKIAERLQLKQPTKDESLAEKG